MSSEPKILSSLTWNFKGTEIKDDRQGELEDNQRGEIEMELDWMITEAIVSLKEKTSSKARCFGKARQGQELLQAISSFKHKLLQP
uniref:Uncharacterized protein n=1 Tax=Fagus sylvatica TaxID=28930 RepID=A0A2N9J385_FAGSY